MRNNKIKKIFSWFKKKNIKINDQSNLFECKKLDSFSFIDFLVFLEKEFKVKIDHESIFNKKKLNINTILKILNK